MAIINKVITHNIVNTTENTYELLPKELEFLILLVKQSTFKGEDVESVYNTVLKLQNQYLKHTK